MSHPARSRTEALAALAVAAALSAMPAAAQPVEVDLELVLAVDTSRSMDQDELVLQREGYAAALEHPAVTSRLGVGEHGRIAIAYFDWGGVGLSRVILDWRVLETEADARAAADELRRQPVGNLTGTGISWAIAEGIRMIEQNEFAGTRRVIDISGDGPNNVGPPVTEARDAAEALGIEINGLPIMLKETEVNRWMMPSLDIYYEDCVITGPSAFVVPVGDTDRFVEAIARKLVLEMSGTRPPERERIRPAAGTDCLAGEKLRRREGFSGP